MALTSRETLGPLAAREARRSTAPPGPILLDDIDPKKGARPHTSPDGDEKQVVKMHSPTRPLATFDESKVDEKEIREKKSRTVESVEDTPSFEAGYCSIVLVSSNLPVTFLF